MTTWTPRTSSSALLSYDNRIDSRTRASGSGGWEERGERGEGQRTTPIPQRVGVGDDIENRAVEGKDGGIPLCFACKHCHFPNEKCRICGHSGKAKAHRRYEALCKSKGPTPGTLHFKFFDRRSSSKEEIEKMWTLAKIMRQHVFVKEWKILPEKEFDIYDKVSRHAISFIGDAPISYCRWRIDEDSGSDYAIIERWCTLHRHRNMKFGTRLMQAAIADISCMKSSLSAIVTLCPVKVAYAHDLIERVGFRRIGRQFERDGAMFQRYILSKPFDRRGPP